MSLLSVFYKFTNTFFSAEIPAYCRSLMAHITANEFSEEEISLYSGQEKVTGPLSLYARLSIWLSCTISSPSAAISPSLSIFNESNFRLESHSRPSSHPLNHPCQSESTGLLSPAQVLRRISPFKSIFHELCSSRSLHPRRSI